MSSIESPVAEGAPRPFRKSGRKKVSTACQRCRRQKLKCDVQRPCTLCTRAGVDCVSEKAYRWKVQGPQLTTPNTSQSTTDIRGRLSQVTETSQKATPKENDKCSKTSEILVIDPNDTSFSCPEEDGPPAGTEEPTPHYNPIRRGSSPQPLSSAAMSYMDEAFQHQDARTPRQADTSAFAANHWALKNAGSSRKIPDCVSMPRSSVLSDEAIRTRSYRCGPENNFQRALISVLPERAPATLLIDNYFDKIHWFMLIFFQSEFRERFQHLFDVLSTEDINTTPCAGFLSLVLAVCLTSVRYTNDRQKTVLSTLGVDAGALQVQLLETLRLRLLDCVSLGSIEAVQTCILLGSFYLYHGEPELAWPICGCGLRIAQALNLHRRAACRQAAVPDLDDPVERATETRKRCWWAIFEIETFCSMLYGLPLSIVDQDCDVELPDPYPLRSKDSLWDLAQWKAAGEATLLSFKHSMAQLSMIVKTALSQLYRNQKTPSDKDQLNQHNNLQSLACKISQLDFRLRSWWDCLPRELRLDENTEPLNLKPNSKSFGPESVSGQQNKQHLFRVQALALKLAFENANILVHRPLLSYKTTIATGSLDNINPQHTSVQACRNAALQIAKISTTIHFKEAVDTYAVSFITLHLFTAGVTLSIMTSLQPLSQESFESKMGLRQVMAMHSQLKAKSVVAEQGLVILKKLMKLAMSRETERMLQFETSEE